MNSLLDAMTTRYGLRLKRRHCYSDSKLGWPQPMRWRRSPSNHPRSKVPQPDICQRPGVSRRRSSQIRRTSSYAYVMSRSCKIISACGPLRRPRSKPPNGCMVGYRLPAVKPNCCRSIASRQSVQLHLRKLVKRFTLGSELCWGCRPSENRNW